MSADEAGDITLCCASCGIAEVDDIKLKKCTACDLVQYCSDECQKNHRKKHKKKCKKRVAELRDEILFRQPESTHLSDCPICFLPVSLDYNKSMLQSCCCKLICDGCEYANRIREMEQNLQQTCPFCRQPVPKTKEALHQNKMKRIKANDPVALREEGKKLYHEGDYSGAFEYYTKAVEIGDIPAHYNLSVLYGEGKGVEKDEKKKLFHLEEAAIGGHPDARYNLSMNEGRHDRIDRAVKHLIIAANLGCDDSIRKLMECYADGEVSKEDFAAALRAHQAAVDSTKSPQREEAAQAEAAEDKLLAWLERE